MSGDLVPPLYMLLRRRGMLELSRGHIGLSLPFFLPVPWIVFIIIRSADSLPNARTICIPYLLSVK